MLTYFLVMVERKCDTVKGLFFDILVLAPSADR